MTWTSLSDDWDKADEIRTKWVFIDSCVYRSHGFDWDGRWLQAVKRLSSKGLLRVVYTPLLYRELRSLLRERSDDAVRSLEKNAVVLRQAGLLSGEIINKDDVHAKITDSLDHWLQEVRAFKCLWEVNLNEVLDDYFESRPPFESGKKKSEFPDAFNVSSVKAWATQLGKKVYVITQDGGLSRCCSAAGPLIHRATIEEIVSAATASEVIHDTVVEAVQRGGNFERMLSKALEDVKFSIHQVENGRQKSTVDVQSARFVSVSGVGRIYILDYADNRVLCEAQVDAYVMIEGYVEEYDSSSDSYDQAFERFDTEVNLAIWIEALVNEDPLSATIEDVSLVDNVVSVEWNSLFHEWKT